MTPQTPIRVIYIIVLTEAALALIGVSALAFSLFYKTYADPSILTALIALTSGLVGSLGTILTNTRQNTAPAEPIPTTIEQPPNNPVPVTTDPLKP